MEDIPVLQEQWENTWGSGVDQRVGGSKNGIRVNQLDAGVLDSQVVALLYGRLARCFEALKPALLSSSSSSDTLSSEDAIEDLLENWKPELNAALRTALWAVTVGLKGQTYGADLQNLAFTQKLGPWLKVAHFSLSVLLPWLWSRADREIALRGWSSTSESTANNWKYKVWRTMRTLEAVAKVCAVFNFLAFLRSGRWPTLADRLLGTAVHVANPGIKRTVLYGQMHRQLLWEGISEVVMLALPLLANSGIRRGFGQFIAAVTSKVLRRGKPQHPTALSDNAAAPPLACRLCGTNPANTPYKLDCSHVFCYRCIWLAREADTNFPCPACGHVSANMSRLSADA